MGGLTPFMRIAWIRPSVDAQGALVGCSVFRLQKKKKNTSRNGNGQTLWEHLLRRCPLVQCSVFKKKGHEVNEAIGDGETREKKTECQGLEIGSALLTPKT